MISLVDGFFEESGCIQAYTFDGVTGEFLGEREIHVSQDCGLPAGAALEPPPVAGEHQVAVRRQNVWSLVPDFRGIVFHTDDGTEVPYTTPGELPAYLTTLPRPSAAHVWDGDAWGLDAELDLEIKTQSELRWIDQQLNQARKEIEKHEDQDSTAIASVEGWRRYRVDLRAWPQHDSFPDQSDRPVAPT